ncbi:PH domain-containing protein [Kocuria tytonis]|uniref:PH domain-containing protein n=2 Tax=Kocuria tytonis TaxID=2054280 RepID=A0A495AAJ4_9MICC|nr:PH domain-containing protein [Kocuria tytonis]
MGVMPKTHEPAPGRETYRAASAPWLTGFLAALGLLVLLSGWGHTVPHHVAAVCGGLALAGLGYALYWRPRLEVRTEGVRLVNPARTVSIPWGRIVDVRTRFAVTIATEEHAHSSFALPASGAGSALRAGADAVNRNHPIARPDGSVRVGDLTSTASGAAAHRVRTLWQRKIDTGELDVFATDKDPGPVRSHVVAGPLAAVVVLGAASVLLYTV